MRLANGMELCYNPETNMVMISKMIDSKLHSIHLHCNSCKRMFILLQGYESYDDCEFKSEAKALDL